MTASDSPRNRFARSASWICLLLSLALPAIFWSCNVLEYWPQTDESQRLLTGVFIAAQALAILIGLTSFYKPDKKAEWGIAFRSVAGIFFGLLSGASMGMVWSFIGFQ